MSPEEQAEMDTDGDTLVDWEEILWGTDPYKADSDGDGVTDDKEVLEKSKEDTAGSGLLALQVAGNSEENTSSVSSGELTLTDIASRELFSSYMSKLKTGDQPTLAEQDAMTTGAINSMKPFIEVPKYSASEALLVPSTQENRVLYFTEIRTLINDMITGATDGSKLLLDLAQDGDRKQTIENIKVTTTHYKKVIEQMKNISVPEDALGVHTSVVSSLELYTYNLEGFQYFESDPMRAAISLQTVVMARTRVEYAGSELNAYAKKYELLYENADESAI